MTVSKCTDTSLLHKSCIQIVQWVFQKSHYNQKTNCDNYSWLRPEDQTDKEVLPQRTSDSLNNSAQSGQFKH